jgi:hypothetical protein
MALGNIKETGMPIRSVSTAVKATAAFAAAGMIPELRTW